MLRLPCFRKVNVSSQVSVSDPYTTFLPAEVPSGWGNGKAYACFPQRGRAPSLSDMPAPDLRRGLTKAEHLPSILPSSEPQGTVKSRKEKRALLIFLLPTVISLCSQDGVLEIKLALQ